MSEERHKPGDETVSDAGDVDGTVNLTPEGKLDAPWPGPDQTCQDSQAGGLVGQSEGADSDAPPVLGLKNDAETRVDDGDVESTHQASIVSSHSDDEFDVDSAVAQEDENNATTISRVVDEKRPVEQTIVTGADSTHGSSFDDRSEAGLAVDGIQRIGRYEVLSVLGEGAFGQVLRCRDPQLDRVVAIKIAKSSAVSDQAKVDRFLREAKSAALLRHPNIIPVFEYGTVDQTHYIAYQFIKGQTLSKWLADPARQSLAQKIDVFAKLADALDYAHECGIVHRDIKPDNILVDEDNRPHIADFGCARMDEGEVCQTVDGTLMGTPAYMSPEQASGNARDADGRSDLWSIGVMLYEQLCGQRPFSGKLMALIQQIISENPTPPSRIKAGLPQDLETICLKCLAKPPEQRFSRCGELAAELRRWLNGEPIQSRPVPPWVRTWMWAKRNPNVATLSGLFVVALLAGTVISATFAFQAHRKQQALVRSQLDSLLIADSASVPLILENLNAIGRGVPAALQRMESMRDLDGRQAMRLNLALASFESPGKQARVKRIAGLEEGLLTADPGELVMGISLLDDDTVQLIDGLWETAEDLNADPNRRLRAAACLAQLDPLSANWAAIDDDIIAILMREPAETLGYWSQALKSRSENWRETLETLFHVGQDSSRREQAALILGYFFAGDVDYLVGLSSGGSAGQLKMLIPFLRLHRNSVRALIDEASELDRSETSLVEGDESDDEQKSMLRTVNLAILACALEDFEPLEAIWTNTTEPGARTESIHRLGPSGIGSQVLRRWLANDEQTEPRLISASLQALAETSDRDLHTTERQTLVPVIADLYKKHPDSGIHGSAAWLLRQWEQLEILEQARSEVVTELPLPGFGWHEDPSGLSFVVMGPIESLLLGDPDCEIEGRSAPIPHQTAIPRRFGISTTEISVAAFHDFEQALLARSKTQLSELDRQQDPEVFDKIERRAKRVARTIANRGMSNEATAPATNISWFEAAAFCNWLSAQQQFPSGAWAYSEEADLLNFQEHGPAELSRIGYRMPTAAEWESFCRAGSATRYSVGSTPTWLSEYDWTIENSAERLHPVGELKPNWAGGHDLHGNATEWCDDYPIVIAADRDDLIVDGLAPAEETQVREIRGGSYRDEFGRIASFSRDEDQPDAGYAWRGFRVARTYPPEP